MVNTFVECAKSQRSRNDSTRSILMMENEIIKFRNILDDIQWENMPIGFRDFPRGTCGDISDILAEHLYAIGYADIQYICGRYNNATHAWLEINGTAVDVTADQFPEISRKVLIQDPQLWHHKFTEEDRRKAGYLVFSGPALEGLRSVHDEIDRLLGSDRNKLNRRIKA